MYVDFMHNLEWTRKNYKLEPTNYLIEIHVQI